MQLKEIKNDRIKEKYYITKHPSGLKIIIYPKKGSNSTYVLFGTKYGSVNNKFKVVGSDEVIEIPNGTAHFLEHKMFENEEGDAFAYYAKTGADANAYTSFDRTCYLFSCTENFEKALKILLNFLQTPYFTDQTVEKEQGIIGQEIKMYEDDANWRVLFNLLVAMYKNHPVNIDIAGSVDSIAKITKETLYSCYKAFYNPNNMAICIAGDIDKENVLKLLNDNLKSIEKVKTESIFPEEEYTVNKKRIEQKFAISSPIFSLGFKEKVKNGEIVSLETRVKVSILLEMIASKSSRLYRRLLDLGLINTVSFQSEYFTGPGYAAIIFSGETTDPDKVADIIRQEINDLRDSGLSKEDFNIAKKSLYGGEVSGFNSVESIANSVIDFEFIGYDVFSYIDFLSKITFDEVKKAFEEHFDTENTSLSIALPNGD